MRWSWNGVCYYRGQPTVALVDSELVPLLLLDTDDMPNICTQGLSCIQLISEITGAILHGGNVGSSATIPLLNCPLIMTKTLIRVSGLGLNRLKNHEHGSERACQVKGRVLWRSNTLPAWDISGDVDSDTPGQSGCNAPSPIRVNWVRRTKTTRVPPHLYHDRRCVGRSHERRVLG